jgi:hypothetical protein
MVMHIRLEGNILDKNRIIYALHVSDLQWLELVFMYDTNNTFIGTKNKSSSGEEYIN